MAFVVDKTLTDWGSSLGALPREDELQGDEDDSRATSFGAMADALESLSDADVDYSHKLAAVLRELGQPKIRLAMGVIVII